jgi:hypothetical protein
MDDAKGRICLVHRSGKNQLIGRKPVNKQTEGRRETGKELATGGEFGVKATFVEEKFPPFENGSTWGLLAVQD